MRRYLYNYQTVVDFGCRISNHSLLLRCQPCDNAFQSVEESHVVMSHDFWLHRGIDAYGNTILFGGTRQSHETLAYTSVGIVDVGDYRIPDALPHPFYAFPTVRTAPNEAIRDSLHSTERDPLSRAMDISHHVWTLMNYSPQCTNNDTTAIDVFLSRCGVCQDYAHLMLAFCHAAGLIARYANGFLEGEGETHAWVEVYDGYAWVGIDPTHDRLIERGYVKLAHGRDAADCPVNRGTYTTNTGNTKQLTSINITLKEI